MTVHQRYGELRCHHCGHAERVPRHCPQCGKVDLRPVGAGTERAEERLGILFPDFPVLRVDRDSTSRKDAMNQLFATIQKGQPCILVGTQMLAKGITSPGDAGVDPRCRRRAVFRGLPCQRTHGAVDRPGGGPCRTSRGTGQGHYPDPPGGPSAADPTDRAGLFCLRRTGVERTPQRRPAALAHLALLRAEAHKPGQAEGFLDEACSEAERLLAEQSLTGIELLGPVPAPMERRAGRYRAQLLLQANARRRCIDC